MEVEREQLSQNRPQSTPEVSWTSPWWSACETLSVSPYGILAEHGTSFSPIHDIVINNVCPVVFDVGFVFRLFQKHAS